ncbi:hypothetical protein ACFLTB_06030 [Chloroflexota bacterium]
MKGKDMKFPRLHGKKIFRVLGIIGLLGCVYYMTIGVILLVNNPEKDIEDTQVPYYDSWVFQVEKDSYAIVIGPGSVEEISSRTEDIYNNVKVKAVSNDPSKRLFAGTAEKEHIDLWLEGVEYDEITDFKIFPRRVNYLNYTGSGTPGSPTAQDFWDENSYGDGKQTLYWKAKEGGDLLVIMNENGAAGLNFTAMFGTKTPIILIGAISHISLGVVILAVSIYFFSFSARTRNVVYPEPLMQLLER